MSSVRDGRRKLHYLNAVPIHEIQTRWIWKFGQPRLTALATIKRHAEEHAMTPPTTPLPAADEPAGWIDEQRDHQSPITRGWP